MRFVGYSLCKEECLNGEERAGGGWTLTSCFRDAICSLPKLYKVKKQLKYSATEQGYDTTRYLSNMQRKPGAFVTLLFKWTANEGDNNMDYILHLLNTARTSAFGQALGFVAMPGVTWFASPISMYHNWDPDVQCTKHWFPARASKERRYLTCAGLLDGTAEKNLEAGGHLKFP